MIPETTIAQFLDFIGYRGNCKECQKPIWWIRDKKNQTPMYTVNLQKHEHAKQKPKPKPDEIRRQPGGEW